MTPAFAAYVEPARRRPQLWRLALGLALITGIYLAWMAAMAGAFWLLSDGIRLGELLGGIGDGANPWGMITLLATFLGMGAGAWAAVRVLHRRGLASLFGPLHRLLPDFALGAGMMLGLGGGLGVLVLLGGPSLEPAMPLGLWLMFLPLALLGVAVQTGAEELVFRGYLQQQLAARFAAPVVWMGLPSVLFGLAHYGPEQMGDNALLVVVVTGFFGLVAADLTARTGGLGLAWGLHFANNVLALLFVSAMGGLNGLALFALPGTVGDSLLRQLLLADMAIIAVVWAACRVRLRRRGA
jgi:membrane protease YdiL (CAAX protease family)